MQQLNVQLSGALTLVATFELQLIALNTALAQVKEWTDANPEDPHYQVSMALGRCLSHCQLLVDIISA